ncbi:MAG: UvrD-helicase domain-containing protein, partial [Planctomycetes bacterium]|nr:UvrD-helicase domain-containing protein [Planctomycetota bacterium]
MRDLLEDLNEPQRQAVTHVDGPLLVLAGAGSGKTRVITRRVAYLVRQGIDPRNILAITFTNKAAEEMRGRIEALHAPRGATICTFHSLCARLLREFAADAGLEPSFSIFDREDQLRLVREVMKTLSAGRKDLAPSRVHAAISNAKNDLMGPEEFAADAEGDRFAARVAEVYFRYQKLLADNNALDFDDLLLRMVYLMRSRPDVRQLLGRRYRYVLIDEYQDTNRAQYLLARGISLEHGNICATGDPDQSIYAWRGADIRNILDFEANYPDARVIRLEENYRSTPAILRAASNLIAHNRQRKEKTLWTRRPAGSDVLVLYCEDERAEADE